MSTEPNTDLESRSSRNAIPFVPNSLLFVLVTEAGLNSKLDERDFLKYRLPKLSSISSTSGSDYPTILPHCGSHWNGWERHYQLDGSLISEESVSSTQSAGAAGYRYFSLQDPIGTPRRLGAIYPGDLYPNLASFRQVGRERERSKANVIIVTAAESSHASEEEDMDLRWMHTADLLDDRDEYLPRRPATPRFAVAPLHRSQEPTRLPRLYAHNPRIHACADGAVRRMRMQAEKPKQNYHPYRRHPITIGGSNPFWHTRQSSGSGEEPLGHIIRSIERLVEDDDEEILAYLRSSLSEKERMPQEVRQSKDSPAALSPQASLSVNEESIRWSDSEVELFSDFPVCVRSIAMGLHDPCL
ncbi:hypothetical protein C0993_002397 [Termitomyces sp. T159_Od127]|nr:hypothetical protein C0993_002397 [Termitomyces sp. T159_Od127]